MSSTEKKDDIIVVTNQVKSWIIVIKCWIYFVWKSSINVKPISLSIVIKKHGFKIIEVKSSQITVSKIMVEKLLTQTQNLKLLVLAQT